MKQCWLVPELECLKPERGFFHKERPCAFCSNMTFAVQKIKRKLEEQEEHAISINPLINPENLSFHMEKPKMSVEEDKDWEAFKANHKNWFGDKK